MLSFDVRFIKTVCDDTGHEHRACQAAFSVQASSLTEAITQAEERTFAGRSTFTTGRFSPIPWS